MDKGRIFPRLCPIPIPLFTEQVDAFALEISDGRIHVIDIKRHMVTTIITGFGHMLVLVRRRVLEELKVCAVTATQCTYLAVSLRMEVEIVIRAPRRVQRIDHLAAKHIHEKLRSLLQIGHSQTDVFDTTHAGDAAFHRRCYIGSYYVVRFHLVFLQTSELFLFVKKVPCDNTEA